ncbi:MAG: hypothetical protein HPAVJP_0040 [Candidatus Hepatoplasma vulgare]|nr:MAG: hypothetical protein HPAVJP_0040 [Candidatus Hepatoplasma sp.]
MEKEVKGIFEKTELAHYVSLLYEKEYNEKISSIKLQKSIYFLFAYWAGFGKKLSEEIKEKKEKGKINEIYLFKNPRFQARQFGPVEIDIFSEYNENIKLSDIENINESIEDISKKLKKINSEAKNFVDSFLTKNIFKISDFSLAIRSHKDLSWKKAWKTKENKNKFISSEKIVEEYFKKYLND